MDMYAHINKVMGDPDDNGDNVAGVRWPTELNGDVSHGWVERYDDPELNTHGFESDEDAAFHALRVLEAANKDEDFLTTVRFGWAVPVGCEAAYPYIDLIGRTP